MGVDRFGNSHAPDLTYARGEILRSTEDDFKKLQVAWSLICERSPGRIYIFTGLEHALPLAAEELQFADDEIAPALSFERLKELALDHLGGSPETDDVAVFNRLTGATMATHLTLVKPGDTVKARCHHLRDGSNGCLLGYLKAKDGTVKDWDGNGAQLPSDF